MEHIKEECKYNVLLNVINEYLEKDGMKRFWEFVEQKAGEKLMEEIPEDSLDYSEKLEEAISKVQDSNNEDLLNFL